MSELDKNMYFGPISKKAKQFNSIGSEEISEGFNIIKGTAKKRPQEPIEYEIEIEEDELDI